jgi:hypothetical protein
LLESATLADKLQVEGKKIGMFMASLDDRQWNVEVYTEGSVWTVQGVFGHLLAAERAFVKLFSQVKDGGPGVSDDFDIDRYNAAQQRRTKGLAPAALIEQFRSSRAQMVMFVYGLGESDLEKKGRHPYLGVVCLRDMIKMIYVHNHAHLRDVQKALNAKRAAA